METKLKTRDTKRVLFPRFFLPIEAIWKTKLERNVHHLVWKKTKYSSIANFFF